MMVAGIVGMTAVPPTELAAPLDLRCEFTGTDLRKVSDWDGLAYLRADYANIGTLSRYFPCPVQISRGEGACRSGLSSMTASRSR